MLRVSAIIALVTLVAIVSISLDSPTGDPFRKSRDFDSRPLGRVVNGKFERGYFKQLPLQPNGVSGWQWTKD